MINSTATQLPTFRNQILLTIQDGIKNESKFEDLTSELIGRIANKLLLTEDFDHRKETINQALKQLEEAKIVRRFNMMHKSPQHNKQLQAALTHLTNQFKLQFARYI